MNPVNRSKRVRVALAAAALALALAACGGDTGDAGGAVTASDAAPQPQSAAPVAPVEPTLEPTLAPVARTEEPSVPEEAPTADEAPAVDAAERPAAVPPAVIEMLSADVAIANADGNISNLAEPANGSSVFDFEVLAVGDGSIQTLSDVVVGDRPVLLWFFSPH